MIIFFFFTDHLFSLNKISGDISGETKQWYKIKGTLIQRVWQFFTQSMHKMQGNSTMLI